MIVAKTAYSPLLKVAGDYSCGIFSSTGDMVAQGPGSSGAPRGDARRRAGHRRGIPQPAEGDVYIHNDPYSGGSHLPDVNVVTPIFAQGRHIAYACVRAHWPDVGSAVPGSYSASTSIYGEGLRIPPDPPDPSRRDRPPGA